MSTESDISALRQQLTQLELRTLVAEQQLAKVDELGSGGLPGVVDVPGYSEGTWLTSGVVCVGRDVNAVTLDLTKRWLVVTVSTGGIRQEDGARPNPMPDDEEWYDLFEQELHVPRFG